MASKIDGSSGSMWASHPGNPLSMVRSLANIERMFVVLNRYLYGQNCPFIGASLSVQKTSPSSHPHVFGSGELEKRAINAFCQTRWRYPTVAAQVVEGNKAIYHIEKGDEVLQWAKRTVKVVVADGGWLALREQVSRDLPIPSSNGDYCLVYLVVKPGEDSGGSITTFDILMHLHHGFTDGTGIRTILNEFISRLANPLPSDQILWGSEVGKLLPPVNIIAKSEQVFPDTTEIESRAKDSELSFDVADVDVGVGLPLYRPDIGPPALCYRGTKLVSHTFEPEFLSKLLTIGRKHRVKLTALLHAALLRAVHETTDTMPGPEDFYRSNSAMDLRNGCILPPYDEKRYYVNSAVVLNPIEVPCNVFGRKDGFWEAATSIAKQWQAFKKQKGMVAKLESECAAIIESRLKQGSAALSKPQTCPYFVSDPPGSHLLDTYFPVWGYENLQVVLESYQLATDQSQATVSARSHSFHDKLTLCLVFNAARNPEEKMQEFLETWKRVLERVCDEKMR